MLLKLFLAFTIIPLIELYILIRVGSYIGAPATIFIVIFTGWLGAWLARREGLRVYGQLQSQLQQGMIPGDPLLEGVLVLASGLMLITPGFMTDTAGLLLLIPAVRKKVVKRIKEHYAERLRVQQGIIDVDVDPDQP